MHKISNGYFVFKPVFVFKTVMSVFQQWFCVDNQLADSLEKETLTRDIFLGKKPQINVYL